MRSTSRVLIAALFAFLALPALAQNVFFEDFQDATAVGPDTLNSVSETDNPAFYQNGPQDAQWVFGLSTGNYLVTDSGGDKSILLNEFPEHALALRHSLPVTVGSTYHLSFDHWGDNQSGGTYSFDVFANDTLLGTVVRQYFIPGAGAQALFSFVADSPSLMLSFRDVSSSLASGIIDNIALAVPEPGTYALLLAGLGLMGFVASRRRGSLRAA